MRKVAVIVGGLAIVLIAAGAAFYGGLMYERSRQASIQTRFFAERGGFPGGPEGFMMQGGPQEFPQPGAENGPQGQAGFGRGASGMVKSLEGDKMLISTPQDVTTVILNDETVVRRLAEGEIKDIQPGQRVLVMGERAEDGTITATSIQILAEQP
jgi:hypothetical protein